MLDVLVFIDRSDRVRAVQVQGNKQAWPNSQGITFRVFKSHCRFWQQLGAFKDSLKLEIIRESQNESEEVFDFFDSLP